MKQNFYKISASNRFQAVIAFLRKELGWKPSDGLVRQPCGACSSGCVHAAMTGDTLSPFDVLKGLLGIGSWSGAD